MTITRQKWRDICSSQLEKPYIWGADGPNAYDCSGFAQWALSQLNLDPPSDQTAEGLYRFFSAGRSVVVNSPAEADLGDLVFFGSDESIGHVGLAWGNGDMIEAGGGGRTTTTVAIARQQGAAVRIKPITRRRDLVAILRPNALSWPDEGLESSGGLEALIPGHGRFDGAPPLTEWLEDGRNMQLKRPFAYIEEDGRAWPVPAEAIVDGASIPQVFWSLIGGPFEGRYRNASIVHDYYCDRQVQPWRDTHRIFYEAMVCSGVGLLRAKVMYYAVYRFGPRWTMGPAADAEGFEAAGPREAVAAPLPAQAFDAASFEADAAMIFNQDPDLGTIEAIADSRVSGPNGDAAGLEGIAREVDALLDRRPLLERLTTLQDSEDDPASAAAIGRMLSHYAAQVREPTPQSEVEAAPPFSQLKPKYEALYASCQVRAERKGEVAWHRQKLLQYRPRYEAVAARTGAPWWFIGVVHALEGSFNFNGHLHNGDPLAARTVQVPAGRPRVWNPPSDWVSSAIDAITYENLNDLHDWDIATALNRWEKYNGFGYYPLGINSPYLWSFSNHYTKGKFVRDRVYDANAVSRQCGAAVMLRALVDAGDVRL